MEDPVEKQRNATAVQELQRWLKGQAEAAALPPGLATTPTEDLRRVCKGEMVPVLAFLLPLLPTAAAAQEVRGNLQVAGSASAALSASLQKRAAELEGRKAKLLEELQAAQHRQAVAVAACAVISKKIQTAEEVHEGQRIKHQETWQRTALFGALAEDCAARVASLQQLKDRLQTLLTAVVEESPSGVPRVTATTLGLTDRARAPPAPGGGLRGAALIRQLEGRCAQCCFALQQALRCPHKRETDKDGDSAAGALAALRRQHVERFTRAEELCTAAHRMRQRNTELRARLEQRLAGLPPATAEQQRRGWHEQQRRALRQAAIAFAKDETLRLLELQSELVTKRRQQQGQQRQLEDLEGQRQQRFQDLRRAVSQTLAQRAAGQRRLAAVAQRLQALPAAAVREALGEPGGLTAAAVTQEVDAAVRLPLAIAIYSAPSTPPVLALGCPQLLAAMAQAVGANPTHSAEAVLRRGVRRAAERAAAARRAEEWHALQGSLAQFRGEVPGPLLALQDRHQRSEAVFRLQCLPGLRSALQLGVMRDKLQEAQAVVEDWVFEPAAYTLSLTVQDLTVEEWMHRYRRLASTAR